MTKQKGTFVISLDLELYWGVRHKIPLENYRENLLGVRFAVPSLLKLFNEHKIHATWLITGFLFFQTRDELIRALPAKRPNYANRRLFPYNHIENIGNNEEEDPFHYAPSLIKMISTFSDQEIGSHTFSHYYCLERGQDIETFKEDLEAAIKVAKKFNLNLESLAFPKNQFNKEYANICRQMGINAYRGNESFWIYQARNEENQSLLIRALRLIDAYFNLSGHQTYAIDSITGNFPFNIPASRYLRYYSHRLKIFEPLRLKRILSGLTYAAKKGLIYHLWWHPYDFGVNREKNIAFLKKILDCYSNLRKNYGVESLTMGEISRKLMRETNYAR